QACYYAAGRLEADIAALARTLPPLPAAGRSATLALEPADAKRARSPPPGAGPLAALVLLGLLAGTAAAGTYYVDISSPQCSPAGPGTLSQPYCPISAAVAGRATAGDTSAL